MSARGFTRSRYNSLQLKGKDLNRLPYLGCRCRRYLRVARHLRRSPFQEPPQGWDQRAFGTSVEVEGSNEQPASNLGVTVSGAKSHAGGLRAEDRTGRGANVKDVETYGDIQVTSDPTQKPNPRPSFGGNGHSSGSSRGKTCHCVRRRRQHCHRRQDHLCRNGPFPSPRPPPTPNSPSRLHRPRGRPGGSLLHPHPRRNRCHLRSSGTWRHRQNYPRPQTRRGADATLSRCPALSRSQRRGLASLDCRSGDGACHPFVPS